MSLRTLGRVSVVGPRIDWPVLVIGLAWRGWLLLYSLPFLAAALMDGREDKDLTAPSV